MDMTSISLFHVCNTRINTEVDIASLLLKDGYF